MDGMDGWGSMMPQKIIESRNPDGYIKTRPECVPRPDRFRVQMGICICMCVWDIWIYMCIELNGNPGITCGPTNERNSPSCSAQPPDENPLIQIQESNHHRHDHATIYTNNFPVPFPIPISLPESESEVVKKIKRKTSLTSLYTYLCLNTQQTQNWCGIQPETTAGHMMAPGWHHDGAVTS